MSVDHETAVLGLAAPPRQPVPGPGRPRTQVEPGSLGSGRPPSLSRQAGHADAADPALTAALITAVGDRQHEAEVAWPAMREACSDDVA